MKEQKASLYELSQIYGDSGGADHAAPQQLPEQQQAAQPGTQQSMDAAPELPAGTSAGASGIDDEDEFLVTLNEPEPKVAAEAVRAVCIKLHTSVRRPDKLQNMWASGSSLCAVCMAGR
jgi:hypothetical protein